MDILSEIDGYIPEDSNKEESTDLSELNDLEYFQKKLYDAMKIPADMILGEEPVGESEEEVLADMEGLTDLEYAQKRVKDLGITSDDEHEFANVEDSQLEEILDMTADSVDPNLIREMIEDEKADEEHPKAIPVPVINKHKGSAKKKKVKKKQSRASRKKNRKKK